MQAGDGASGVRSSSLLHEVQQEHDTTTLVIGPLPPDTTASQVIVEVSLAEVLEVSLEGAAEDARLTHRLPPGVTDDMLKVKFSKKKRTLTVSWQAPADEEKTSGESSVRDPGANGHGQAEVPLEALSLNGTPAAERHGPAQPLRAQQDDEKTSAGAAHSAEQAVTPRPPEPVVQDAGASRQNGAGAPAAAPAAPSSNNKKQNKKKNKGKNKSKGAGQAHQGSAAIRDADYGLEDLEATADALAEQLLQRGYAYMDNFLSPDAVSEIVEETQPLVEFFEPGEIWVGKEAQAGAQVARNDVRGDSILWMNFQTMISNNCMTLHRAMRRMDTLIMNMLPRRVPRLANVSEHSDAMLSLYPPGTRFQKHIDNTARDGRCLTVLLYLNVGWTPEMGGELKLWPLKTGEVQGSLITTAAQTLSRGGGMEPVELSPVAGRLAMFYSDRVLHEVLVSHCMRHAVTQWYYDRNERAEALAAAKADSKSGKASGGSGAAGSGVDAQAEAHAFIRALMVDTTEPSPELIRSLVQQVEQLSPGALQMASQIMGASKPQDLVQAVKDFTPQTLKDIRAELTSMGQQ